MKFLEIVQSWVSNVSRDDKQIGSLEFNQISNEALSLEEVVCVSIVEKVIELDDFEVAVFVEFERPCVWMDFGFIEVDESF